MGGGRSFELEIVLGFLSKDRDLQDLINSDTFSQEFFNPWLQQQFPPKNTVSPKTLTSSLDFH